MKTNIKIIVQDNGEVASAFAERLEGICAGLREEFKLPSSSIPPIISHMTTASNGRQTATIQFTTLDVNTKKPKLEEKKKLELHPLVSKIDDKYILTNHEEGSGTGVIIYNSFTLVKELQKINIEDFKECIDWDCKFHKIYFEDGHVINIEAIKDDKHLSDWLISFDEDNHNSLRTYKFIN